MKMNVNFAIRFTLESSLCVTIARTGTASPAQVSQISKLRRFRTNLTSVELATERKDD